MRSKACIGIGIGMGTLLVALLVEIVPRNPSPPPAASATARVDAPPSPSQPLSSPPPLNPQISSLAPRVAPPRLDGWTKRILAANVPNLQRLDRDVFSRFEAWRRDYLADPRTVSLADGIRLARLRRQSLKELIKLDPQAAWDWIVHAHATSGLPSEIQTLLAKPVAAEGDWEVYSICFSNLPIDGYAEVRLPAGMHRPGPLFGFGVGHLDEAGSAMGIQLTGYVIDDVGVFDGEPPRRLEPGSPLPAGHPLHPTDPISGQRVAQAAPGRDAVVPPGAVAWFTGTDTLLFENDDHLTHWLNAPPPPDPAADGGEQGAPALSESGTPDSLPLSGVQGGSNIGGLSLGYRTMLYIRIAFADDPNEVVQSESGAYGMLRSANNHLIESSYGRMQLLGTVTPIIVLPQPQSYYAENGTGTLSADARAAASSLGYDPNQYGHRVFRYNGEPGTFGGLAQVTRNPGDIWMRGNWTSVLVHEIGHNYKLRHGNGWNTDGKAAIGPSGGTEYEHRYDVMGSGIDFNRAQFCSYQKDRLGWLTSAEWIDNHTSQRLRLAPLDQGKVDPDKRYAARIRTPSRGDYWIEYRRNYTTNPFQNGVLLQARGAGWILGDSNSLEPNRIDVTYWSKDNTTDSCIPIGWTFSDHEQGVHITPIARGADQDWIDVQIHRGPFPSNQPPTLTLNASATVVGAGASVSFIATASDPDGDPLAYHWYFDDEEWHRDRNGPNQSFAWNDPGGRSVICTVSDMKGGVSVQHVPIRVGIPTTFNVSGRVKDHAGAGVAAVPVDNGLSKSDGGYRSTLTDDNGDYLLTGLTAGDYTLRARKDYDDYDPDFANPLGVHASKFGNDFSARTLRLTPSAPTLAENGGTATITIERVGGSTGSFNDVRVALIGKAVEGVDYTLSPPPVNDTYTLSAGLAALNVTVTGVNDALAEGPEDLVFTFRMTDGLSVLGPEQAVSLTVLDDDTPLPRVQLLASDLHLNEDGGSAIARVRRFGDLAAALHVALAPSAGSGIADAGTDYQVGSGGLSVSIPAGQSEAAFAIQALPDAEVEGTERILLSIAPGSYLIDSAADDIDIDLTDDDIPVVTVSAIDGEGLESPVETGTVRVARDAASVQPLEFEFRVRGIALHGTDYQQLAGTGVIPGGAAFVDLPITPLSDALSEGAETVILSLTSDASDYTIGGGGEATVTIVNADTQPAINHFAVDRAFTTPQDWLLVTWDTMAADTLTLKVNGAVYADVTGATQTQLAVRDLVGPGITNLTPLTITLEAANGSGAASATDDAIVLPDDSLLITDEGTTAPTQDVVHQTTVSNGVLFTELSDPLAGSESIRGQLFTAPQDFQLGRATLQVYYRGAGNQVPGAADPRRMKFEVWRVGSPLGITDDDEQIFAGSGLFPASIADGHYVTFHMPQSIHLFAGERYAFLVRWNTEAGNHLFFGEQADSDPTGALLRNQEGWPAGTFGNRDLIFFLQAGFTANDTDNDGLPDPWEEFYFNSLERDGTGDQDDDGLSDALEFELGTDPTTPHSDGDPYGDAWEYRYGFDPAISNTLFNWRGLGDGESLYQEPNWFQLQGAGETLTVDPDLPISHHLLSTFGSIGGAAGFDASLNLGSRRYSMQGGVLRGESTAGITGDAAGRLRLGGGRTMLSFVDRIRTETTGAPELILYSVRPFLNDAELHILAGSSPRITIEGTTVNDVIHTVLPHIRVEGEPARTNTNVEVVGAGADVHIIRTGDTDADGMTDRFEWDNGYHAADNADGAADDDGDGLPNWVESRLGTPLDTPTPGFRVSFAASPSAGTTIRAEPGGTNLLYRIHWSPSLMLPWDMLDHAASGLTPAPYYDFEHTNVPSDSAFYYLEVLDGTPPP